MVVMAQPLADGIAPLRICSFGSDNRFTSADVKNRLDFIKDILKKNDIEVLGYSTDGDSRELKTMREQLKLGTKKVNKIFSKRATWFVADIINTCIPFQDTVHEGAKLRTRFLKTHMSLPFGNYVAHPSCIRNLMDKVGKDKHLLLEGDLYLKDKMNYDAVGRLCRPEVRELLAKYVSGSAGTCFFLKLMSYITSSFIQKDLTPLERVYRMWYAVMSLRYWRFWMSCDATYPLAKHFISLNAYLCAEINAHSLVLMILRLREDGTPDLFLTWLFSSQPCESFFKFIRATSPVGSTQINCTMGEVQSRTGKV
jgi:hypothetical protein